MITKIDYIKNIGSFFNFDWDAVNPSLQVDARGNPVLNGAGHQKVIHNEFKKFNVQFGENGTGKTTLVKLFKALNEESVSHIRKHWDHENDPSSFKLDTDSTPVTYSDTVGIQGNLFKEKILIFDRDYIDNFVHSFPSGRAVNHNKNTGSLILYLGNFFQYRTQLSNISQLKKKLQEKNDQLKIKRDSDFVALNPTIGLDEVKHEFDKLDPAELADLENQIAELTEVISKIDEEIKAINQKISKADEILKAEIPKKAVHIINLALAEIDKAFSFSVSAAAAKAMSQVSGREDFIREGIQITHDHSLDNCPFCLQSIKTDGKYIQSIAQFEAIFDATFGDEQQKARTGLQSYRTKILEILGFQLPERNAELVARINSLLSQNDQLPNIVLSELDRETLHLELEKIELKQSDITKAYTSNVSSVVAIIDVLNTKIDSYNLKVSQIQQQLLDAQKDVSSGDLPRQKEVLQERIVSEKLKLFIRENYSSLKQIFSTNTILDKNSNTIKKLGELFEILRKKVEELFQVFVGKYFTEIEKNLSIFCPNLELKVVGTNARYDLRMGSTGDVTCGLEVHYKDRDRLRDLSEGERQSIALSYFLAFLNRETNKSQKIVVFDDPINSFDAGRRKQAAELIYKECINFNQLFIFTCDSLFKSYCLKVSNKHLGDQRNFYYILKSASSAIHYRPREYQTIYSSFKQDFLNIGAVNGTDDMIVVYGQKLRYCLEEIKDRHLGYAEDKFDNILNAIETGRITDLVGKIDEIRELYSYCNTGGLAHFPKDGQTSWSEIKSQIAKYLKLGL